MATATKRRVLIPDSSSRAHNYDAAAVFGELVEVRVANPFNLSRIMADLRDQFGQFTEEDTILLGGKYSVLACAIAMALSDCAKVNIAIWDAKRGAYVRRELNFDETCPIAMMHG